MTSIGTDALFFLSVAVLVQDVRSKVLYHYTDEKGSHLISGSGYLKSSTGGLFGPAVYLTSYSLWYKSRSDIAYNNWANRNPTSLSKTKCVYEVDVSGAEKQSSNRDIYLYKGGYIVFKQTNDWNLYGWTSEHLSVVIGKHTKQCLTQSTCIKNKRRKRSVGIDGFATCSGQTTKRSILVSVTLSIVVYLLLCFIAA